MLPSCGRGGVGAIPAGGTAMAGTSTGDSDGGKAGAANGAGGNVSQGGEEDEGQAGMGSVDGGECENLDWFGRPSSSATTYEIAVLKTGLAPPAPKQLAFTVPGSPAPELRLRYCPP